MFKDLYHPAVKKDLKRIDPATRLEIKAEWIPTLLAEPHCGEELSGILAGIRSFHFRIRTVDYRNAYRVQESELIVEVLMIAKRENFYQILRRRLK